LNKLAYESSDANRYATFFYGELDTTSRAFTYVNAGHNAPMVFRQTDGGREVVRLDSGGPVIGLMEDCVYRQDCVTLAAGDVLVAYTDGISEAMNAVDEEWGEERLTDARPAEPCRDRALAHRAVDDRGRQVRRWRAAARRHDPPRRARDLRQTTRVQRDRSRKTPQWLPTPQSMFGNTWRHPLPNRQTAAR
jgi:hypothetical protein